jgi:uncharacterized protein (DUF2147 family)
MTMNRTTQNTLAVCVAAWVLIVCLAPVLVWAEANVDDIFGRWTAADGKSRVEIYKAGDGTIEGRICWLRDPVYPADDAEAGKPMRDRLNPDPSLTNRPLMGLVIMKGFKPDGPNRWSGGTVYDPECGKTYKGKMSLDADRQTLNLRGYVGISLFGRTEKWIRYRGHE